MPSINAGRTPNIKTERRAFVLLSGGLDSTTCLHKALHDFHQVEAVSVDYGQRHRKEMDYAKLTCERLNIAHTILNLVGILGGAMLTDSSIEIPNVSYGELPEGVSPTYVPFRNGTLLSLITAHAQKWVNDAPKDYHPDLGSYTIKREAGIYFGAHSEDAANWAYPDCTPEFIGAMANAIYIGSYQAIRLYTPLQWLMKDEIVLLGLNLEVNFEDTWSCYKGDELHCGVCPTCRSRREAFITAGAIDPTDYAEEVAPDPF